LKLYRQGGSCHRNDDIVPASLFNMGRDAESSGLISDAAAMGTNHKQNDWTETDRDDYADRQLDMSTSSFDGILFPTGLDRFLALFGITAVAVPIEQAIARKRRGLGEQRLPVAAWGLTIGRLEGNTAHASNDSCSDIRAGG
jgi:hypothetical protein